MTILVEVSRRVHSAAARYCAVGCKKKEREEFINHPLVTHNRKVGGKLAGLKSSIHFLSFFRKKGGSGLEGSGVG